jgi:hypothetical protein
MVTRHGPAALAGFVICSIFVMKRDETIIPTIPSIAFLKREEILNFIIKTENDNRSMVTERRLRAD